MSSAEAAEFAKLADTTYRDVNIALANEFAAYADRIGVDVTEVIAAANSQPYSHIHQPGSGSAATASRSIRTSCSIARPELALVALARGRERRAGRHRGGRASETALGGPGRRGVLVLGLTYRHGVKELAYSRALPLIDAAGRGRRPRPRLRSPARRDDEVRALGAEPWRWGEPAPASRRS